MNRFFRCGKVYLSSKMQVIMNKKIEGYEKVSCCFVVQHRFVADRVGSKHKV